MKDTLAPGLRLGNRYTLLRPLGRGGMASVWAAETDAHQPVAVKLLTAELAQNDELVARFFQEAHTASRIGHPGIVRVIDTGQAPWGAPFLVMEELVGLSLADLLARHGRFTPAQATAVLVPMLDAVAAAHAAGVVHRDLKPENVFITLAPTPTVKLLDFGISKVLTTDTRLTGTGMVFGTPAYMAPEQVREARQATSSSDLYSVGVIAFELLTGRLPLTADNPLALASAVLTEQPPPLLSVRGELPVELGRLIDRALSKDPALRPPHAHVFKTQLAEHWPADTRWLFERAHQLLGAGGSAAAAPTLRTTARPRGKGEVSLAVLVDRQALAPELAVRVACEVLLDPSAPRTVAPGQVLIDADGGVRAAPGTPLKSLRGAELQSFAAPEAWDGRASALSLQFSLGAVLLHAVTRRAPFAASDEAGLRAKVSAAASTPLLGALPPALVPVVRRMLSADPLQRFPDAGACATELTAAVRTSPLHHRAAEELGALTRSQAAPVPLPPAPTTEPRRTPVALLAVLVLVSGVAAWRLWLRPVEVAPPVPTEEEEAAPVEPADAPPPRGLLEVAPKPPSLVQVTTEPPGAALWLEGEFRGNTPGQLTLPQGKTWHVHFELPGHESAEATVNPDGAARTLSLTLTPTRRLGRVRFEVSDATRLWLDDVLVAEGSLELPVEADVQHTLEVEVNGRRSAPQPLTVKEGELRRFRQ